jgi:hypothetical protein
VGAVKNAIFHKKSCFERKSTVAFALSFSLTVIVICHCGKIERGKQE